MEFFPIKTALIILASLLIIINKIMGTGCFVKIAKDAESNLNKVKQNIGDLRETLKAAYKSNTKHEHIRRFI